MRLLVSSRAMYGLHFQGRRYDIGSKVDFVKTNLEFALERPEMHDELMEFVREVANRDGGTKARKI